MGAGLERIVAATARRPRRVLAVLAVLALAGAALALRLEPSAATDTLAGRSSDAHRATERFRERFGDHAIVVLVRGPLPQLVLTDNLGRLLGLEGCLSGNRPPGRPVPGGRGRPVRGACPRAARCGSCTGRAPSSTPRWGSFRTSSRAAPARPRRRPAGRVRRRARWPGARAGRGPSRRDSAARRSSSRTRGSSATCCSSARPTGSG